MKLVGEENILPNCSGTITIVPEEPDDLWILYDLISKDDVIVAKTTRKIAADTTRKTSGERVKFEIEMKVTATSYDQVASVIRVTGRNLLANEWINCGAFHSLEIERNTTFHLKKKSWDSDAIAELRTSANSGGADLAVLLVQEASAELYLIGKVAATLCAKIESASKAKNKAAAAAAAKSRSQSSQFLEGVMNAFVEHINFDVVRLVVVAVASPAGSQFWQYLQTESRKPKFAQVGQNKDRLLMVSTPGKTNLSAVLREPKVMNVIQGTSCAVGLKAWDELTEMVKKDESRTCYGMKSVEKAHQLLAIDTLYVSYELYHSDDNGIRRRYMDLVKSIRKAGGNVMIYSSDHVMGKQLHMLTGIAAVLRYPLPDLDEMEL